MDDFKILVVEDNNNNIATMQAVLSELEICSSFYAKTGNDALKMMSKNPYDLVLLDISLPDITGYELLSIIKNRKSTSNIPVILISGMYMETRDRERGFELGAIDYILKPYSAIEIRNKVNLQVSAGNKINNLLSNLIEKNSMLESQNENLKKSYEKIEYLTYHDGLTSLYNRSYYENRLIKENIYDMVPITVIIADLNNLKLVNDAFGHATGDKLLCMAAEYLNESFRTTDIIIRWGGDEFMVLMPETNYETAQNIIGRIINKQFTVSSDFIAPHMAVGAATLESTEESLSSILVQAENRMYRNKLLDNKSYRSSIIESLKKSLFEKDFETEHHTERVAELVCMMADTLKLSVAEKDAIHLLATLHDIGKIAVPEEILMKPGKLTRDEWKIIKRHPEIGYNICKTIPELAPMADNILCHHERWDGKGYPQNISGKNIPLLARIISIADAYDVMTNKRPYKGPMTEVDALKELKRCAGSQFDPELVDIFIKTMEFKEILM